VSVQDGAGGTLSVARPTIIDGARGTSRAHQSASGTHFVAIDVSLRNPGRTPVSGDANSDMVVVGTNARTYRAVAVEVRGCPNFATGSFTLRGGYDQSGCVTFDIPDGVNVKQVRFTLDRHGEGAVWSVTDPV
jgi:hypothetical protein